MAVVRGSARILLVDDEPSVTAGLELALREKCADIATVRSGPAALELFEEKRFDVLVTDAFMDPMSGAELCEKVAMRYPEVIRILLTGTPTLASVLDAVNKGGVTKVLLKSSSFREVVEAIESVLHETGVGREGESTVSPLSHLTCGELEALTVRERQVLVLFGDGKRTNQLAEELCISRHTLRNHLKTIFFKLGVHSQSELLRKLRGESPRNDSM